MKKISLIFSILLFLSACSSVVEKRSAIVVGGGLAGLTAAYELEQKNYHVTILEARNRLGGRVHTTAFDNGQFVEAGAELIDENTIHPQIHHYAKQFGLEMADVGYDDDNIADGAYYLSGKRFAFDSLENELGKKAAQDEEKFWDALYKLGQQLSDATQPHLAENAEKLDAQSAETWVDSLKLHPEIRQLALHHIRSEYGEPSHLSLLFLAQQQKAYENIEDEEIEIYRIKGGNSKLIEAFAKNIKGKIVLNSPVVTLNQSEAGATATTAKGKRYHAEYVVVTVPAPVLDKITFKPDLPETIKTASTIQFGHHNKAMLQYAKRFWVSLGLGGDTQSDLPIGWVWEGTDQQSGEAGALITYTSGDVAKEESGLSDDEVIAKRRAEIETMYPEAKGLFLSGKVQRWSIDPWINGGFAAYGVGQVIPYWTAFQQPHQFIYFAGEHTDDLLPGYMEGAIRSGQRAAKQIP